MQTLPPAFQCPTLNVVSISIPLGSIIIEAGVIQPASEERNLAGLVFLICLILYSKKQLTIIQT